MQFFELKIYDDELQNRQQFIDFLASCDPDVKVSLYIHEGASLYQCGVMDIIIASGIAHNITIDTGNEVESVNPATRHQRFPITKLSGSAFWHYAYRVYKQYKFPHASTNSHHRMAYMIGRRNMDRLAIMYWLYKQPFDCLLSATQDSNWQYISRADLDIWVDNRYSFEQWCKNFPVTSFDQLKQKDFYHYKNDQTEFGAEGVTGGFHYPQYQALKFYHAFDVELIAETFVRGNAYYPTEKTIRPIMGNKPFLVYGPKYYLTHLKSNGLQTFSDCWDESYDKYEGAERWVRMQHTITQIHAWSDVEWSKVMERAKQVSQHNQQIFINESNNH